MKSSSLGDRFIKASLAATILFLVANVGQAVVVRYHFSLNGSAYGTVDVRLFQTAMPRTVANFLEYVDDDDWDGSFIHRRAGLGDSGVAVVQGGGFIIPPSGLIEEIDGQLFLDYDQVPTDPPIADEPGGGVAGPSNVRGTIAMAKSGPDTATSQWYFNTIDNTVLDDPNASSGGFSAFGRVLGSGMTVIDNISNLPRISIGGAFTHVPVYDIERVQTQVDVFNSDAVLVTDISRLDIPAGDYDFNGTVNALDYTVWKNSFGSTTNAAADGNGDGIVNAADYSVWRDTFGQTSGSGASSISLVAVPEPLAAYLLTLAVAQSWLAVRRRCTL